MVWRASEGSVSTYYVVPFPHSGLYGNQDDDTGSVPATFQLVHFIGWKPDKSQLQPAKRGSASVSLKDIGKLVSDEQQQQQKSDPPIG